MKLSGAEILLEGLKREGVDLVFGYPGGAVIPLYDKLVKYPEIRHILVRHEQAAAFAANGVGRITGKPGVCFATSGPGATNLVTGVADAHMDNVPMVAITGQVYSHLIGSDAFQESDAIGIFMPVVKHSYQITKAEEIAPAVKEAFYIAQTGRPGPVHLDITKDAQLNEVEFSWTHKIHLPGFQDVPEASAENIKKAAELLETAKRPVVIVGHGSLLSGAQKEVSAFLKKLDIPAVCTLLGLGALETNHPMNLGMLGMHGHVYANYAVHNSDLVISLGSRFDDRITGRLKDFAPDAKIIHCDIDPAEIDKNVAASVPLVGDVKATLQKLLPLVKLRKRAPWWKVISTWKAKYVTEKVHACETQRCTESFRATDALRILAKETKGDIIMVSDVGQHQMWAAQILPVTRFNSHLYSGGLGAMGFALPTAMGVQLSRPREEVWVVCGDGGIQMNSQELITLIQDNIPLKIAIINNKYLGMVRQWQEMFHDKTYSFVNMLNPDFVKLAEANGIAGFSVKSAEEAQKAIRKARKIKGPVLIDFSVATEENVFPMVAQGDSLGETRTR